MFCFIDQKDAYLLLLSQHCWNIHFESRKMICTCSKFVHLWNSAQLFFSIKCTKLNWETTLSLSVMLLIKNNNKKQLILKCQVLISLTCVQTTNVMVLWNTRCDTVLNTILYISTLTSLSLNKKSKYAKVKTVMYSCLNWSFLSS